ncbi:MAG: YigZ family protein [Mycoplasma sp.]|nr:YigZ family protein [Mycoplasma sp.]
MSIQPLSTFTYEIKKSKFIGIAYHVTNTDEVINIFNELKKEHKNARHVTYAYKLKENEIIKIKGFDDKEPKNTASLPILNAIENNNLINIVIFVIRYFGKIKLGIGGLYRSYSKCSIETIKNIKK